MLKTGPCTVMKTTSKDDDEINHLHISLSKKCDKVHAGEIRSTNCGDGEGTLEDCGCDTKPSNCSDCTALCTGQHGNKPHSQYICPDNGVTEMFYDKCKKYQKETVKCKKVVVKNNPFTIDCLLTTRKLTIKTTTMSP